MSLKVIRETSSKELRFCDIARGTLFRLAVGTTLTSSEVNIKTGDYSYTQLTGGVGNIRLVGAGDWAVIVLEGTLTVKEKG